MSTYTDKLRKYAQSILEGVQRLETTDVTADDDDADVLDQMKEADSAIWTLLQWVEGNRREDVPLAAFLDQATRGM